MNNYFYKLFIILVIFMIIGGCMPVDDKPIQTASMPSTAVSTPSKTTTPTLSNGPLLLIQINYEEYHIIDIFQQTIYPFDPPGEGKRYDLAENLSPNRKKIFFSLNDENIVIVDFDRKQEHLRDELNLNASLFQPEKAAEEALEIMPELDISYGDVLSSVTQAFSQSKTNLQWCESDRYLLFVLENSETSTNLHLKDLQTGTQIQLEEQPALVQDYWISPGGDDILLKKGFMFEVDVWQDDSYYLIDIDAQDAEPITLPPGSDHPSLSWLGTQYIGITHQTLPLGGVDFTVVNALTLESTQIIQGTFSQINLFDEKLLVLSQDQEMKTSYIELMDFTGQILKSHRLDDVCVVHATVNGKILLNCEMESLLLDESLQPQSFGDPIFLLSPAPDRQSSILVTRHGKSYLLDADLTDRQSLALNGSLLEILWLPDSSGFLYRIQGKLYYYDLQSKRSLLLVNSDLFGDYTNMNAVWINID